jgi:F0F1-type ATP synthase assembly protein I
MEPSEPRAFPPAEAGALLAVVTLLSIALGTLIGWIAGSLKAGLIVGAVVGIPAGIGAVYIRYHDAFA